jgi:hypothetical protein
MRESGHELCRSAEFHSRVTGRLTCPLPSRLTIDLADASSSLADVPVKGADTHASAHETLESLRPVQVSPLSKHIEGYWPKVSCKCAALYGAQNGKWPQNLRTLSDFVAN